MKIRLNLKKAREIKKITQVEVANFLNMAVTSYQRIELGTRGTSEDNWLELFNLFDCKVPLHELMENTKTEELFQFQSKNS